MEARRTEHVENHPYLIDASDPVTEGHATDVRFRPDSRTTAHYPDQYKSFTLDPTEYSGKIQGWVAEQSTESLGVEDHKMASSPLTIYLTTGNIGLYDSMYII